MQDPPLPLLAFAAAASGIDVEDVEVKIYDGIVRQWLSPSAWFPQTSAFAQHVWQQCGRKDRVVVKRERDEEHETDSEASSSSGPSVPNAPNALNDEAIVCGEKTRAERDAELRANAIVIDAEARRPRPRRRPPFEERRQQSLIKQFATHLAETKAMLDEGDNVLSHHFCEYGNAVQLWEVQKRHLVSIRKKQRYVRRAKKEQRDERKQVRAEALEALRNRPAPSQNPVVCMQLRIAIP